MHYHAQTILMKVLYNFVSYGNWHKGNWDHRKMVINPSVTGVTIYRAYGLEIGRPEVDRRTKSSGTNVHDATVESNIETRLWFNGCMAATCKQWSSVDCSSAGRQEDFSIRRSV